LLAQARNQKRNDQLTRGAVVAGTLFPLILAAAPVTPRPVPEVRTIDELLEGHLEARGGRQQLAAVRSMRVVGRHALNSEYSAMRLLRNRPNRYRLDARPRGQQLTLAYDGKTPWWVDPSTESARAAAMPLDGVENVLADADFDGPLIDYRAKGHQVELLGVEERDTGEAYALRVQLRRGAVEHWYLDRESLLAVERVSKHWEYRRIWELRTFFSDFRRVDGIILPHLIESEFSSMHRLLQIEKVELNLELPDELFERPADQPLDSSDSREGGEE
jgi:hypothetical protein